MSASYNSPERPSSRPSCSHTPTLCANALATPAEEAELRGYVLGLNKEKDDLDAKIAMIELELKLLQARREQVTELITTHSAMFSSLRHMPTELWQQIFQLCRVGCSDWGDRMRSSLRVHGEPWNISQVCRHWKAIALSTPELWSSVRIPYDTLKNQEPSVIFNRLSLQLERSATRPLDVSVIASKDIVAEPTQNGIYYRLLDHASRWENVYFRDDDYSLSTMFYLSFSDLTLPLLKQVHMEMPADQYSDVFKSSPNLQHVSFRFSNKFRFNGPLEIELPWCQLESCELYDMPAYAAAQFLDQLLNLQVLHLGTVDITPLQLRSASDHFVFPNLHTLSVDLHPRTADWFISRLRTPNLKTFKLPISTAMSSSIPTFIKQFGSNVSNIHFTDLRTDAHLIYLFSILAPFRVAKNLTLTLVENINLDVLPVLLAFSLCDSTVDPDLPTLPSIRTLTIIGKIRYTTHLNPKPLQSMIDRFCALEDQFTLGMSREVISSAEKRRRIMIEGFDGWTEDVLQDMRGVVSRSQVLELSVFGRMDGLEGGAEARELI